jgi:hypothetical protein
MIITASRLSMFRSADAQSGKAKPAVTMLARALHSSFRWCLTKIRCAPGYLSARQLSIALK